jgi:DNA-binding beta-propeller fold protein YncE
MYVTGYLKTSNNTGTVTVISTSSNSIVTVIGVGKHVEDVAYSPKTGEIYTTNFGSVAGLITLIQNTSKT